MDSANLLLLHAIETSNLKDLKQAITLGANLNLHIPLSDKEITALMSAVKDFIMPKSSEEKLRLFWKTPLIYAIEKRNESIINQLVLSGADVNALPTNGRTALSKACKYGLEATVNCLVNAGADVNLTPTHGKRPLGEAQREPNPAIVDFLLLHKASI